MALCLTKQVPRRLRLGDITTVQPSVYSLIRRAFSHTRLRLRYPARMPPSPALSGHTAIVITASDRCFQRKQEDLSGPAVAEVLTQAGAHVAARSIVPDDIPALTDVLLHAAASAALVLTTGGTGLSARDNTPEATLAVCDRLVPGLAELIRQRGAEQTPFAALGRGICGVCGKALILNLPGSPRGAVASLRSVLPLLPHALDLLAGNTEHSHESEP